MVLEANKQSVVLASLANSMKTDLSYKITKNIPNISTQLVQVTASPSSTLTPPENKELYFTLPRYGIMQDLYFQSTLTNASTSAALTPTITGLTATGGQASTVGSYQTTPGGLSLFNVVELRSHNRIICTNDDNYLRVRTDCEQFGRGEGVRYRARFFSTDGVTPVATWPASAAVVTYTPFFCSFTESEKNYLDLNFIEQLQVHTVFNSDIQMGLTSGYGTTGSLSTATVNLWMYYYNMQSDFLSELRARNFGPERPYVCLGYDRYTEINPITSGVTTQTLTLKNNNATFATHFFMKDNTYNWLYPIQSYSFQVNGRTIYNSVPVPIGSWISDRFGGAGLMIFDQNTTNDANTYADRPFVGLQYVRPISLFWGLDPKDRTYNSGALAYHNVNNPQLVLNFAATSAANTTAYIIHEFWQLVSINSADGVVSVAIST